MSIIRCLSNPEELYVYHDCSGPIVISCKAVLDRWGNPEMIEVPAKSFYRACQKWRDGIFDMYDEGVSHRGIIVREVPVYSKSRRIVPKAALQGGILKRAGMAEYNYQIMFQYKKYRIFMWRVTWAYIVNNAVGRIARKKRRKRESK